MGSSRAAAASMAVAAVIICLAFAWTSLAPCNEDSSEGEGALNGFSGDWLRMYTYPSNPPIGPKFSDILSITVSEGKLDFETDEGWRSSAVMVSEREAVPIDDHNMQIYLEDDVLYCIEIHTGGPKEMSYICYGAYTRGGSVIGDSILNLAGSRFQGTVASIDDEDRTVASEGTIFIDSVEEHMASVIATVGLGALELTGFVKTFGDRIVMVCVSVDEYTDFIASMVIDDGGCLVSSVGDAPWSFVSDGASMPMELPERIVIEYRSVPDLSATLEVVGSAGAYWTELFGHEACLGFIWTCDSTMLFCKTDLGDAIYADSGDGKTFHTLGDER